MYINWEHPGAVLEEATAAGNTLTKTGGVADTWDAAGWSTESFSGDGTVVFTVGDPETDVIIVGISLVNDHSVSVWEGIEFGLFTWGGNYYSAMEDGAVPVGGADLTGLPPVAGDVIRITVASGVVRWYINDVLEYTSLVAQSDGEYHVDVALYGSNDILAETTLVDAAPVTTGAEATITVEMRTGASTWTTIPDVVAKFGIQLRYGLGGAGLRDRVATTGSLSFVLDNSEANDAGKVGYYSPGHANVWAPHADYPFDLGSEVRLKIVYGALTYYKFRGRIDDLDIIAGKYTIGGKKTKVTVVDWMDQAARATVSGISIQQNKRSDEIFSTIVDAMDTAPAAEQVGYGQDTYPYALDNTRDESFSVMSEFTRLASSEFGFIFVKGDNAQGGTLVFENRLKRGQKTSAVASLDDLILTDMPVSYGRDDVLNNVQVQIYPRRIDSAATTVLFTLQNEPQILAGTTLTVKGTYRDPASGAKTRVGGIEMVTPVITTDYKFRQNADGTGADYDAQLTIVPDASYTAGGNSVTLAITNNGPEDGYLTLMQTRGKGIYAFESVLFEKADSASQTKYGDNIARVPMPYQGDSVLGEEVAYYVLSQNKTAAIRVLGATFVGNDTDANMLNAINREISDRIAIEEPVTAVDTEYFINAVEWDISPGGIVRCSWDLAPASLQEYWILETTGFTELDETTVLAYGLFAPAWQLDVSNLGVDTTVNAV